jgi:glyoxylase-like metal-dependent hydrolase (beta-lactamase superfamily II)
MVISAVVVSVAIASNNCIPRDERSERRWAICKSLSDGWLDAGAAERDRLMSDGKRKRELARADRVLPGVWRLRLPLPWPAVPHCNAFAISAGDGVVLVDTGIHGPGSLAQLERALDQAGLRLEHVRLVVCTHAHADHYGLAAPIVAATGCELWMHPGHAHMTRARQDPARAVERRVEVARQSGVPLQAVERYRERMEGDDLGVAGLVMPDRDLLPGVEVETSLGRWQVHETPGHAPSHVVLHQPEQRLLLSGDHVLGRASLYFDFGYTPDPVAEYLDSLDRVRDLDVDLVLAGHGRPVRDLPRLVGAHEQLVAGALDRTRAALGDQPRTPFELVPEVLGIAELPPAAMGWGLTLTLCYLRHLERRGEAAGEDATEPARWRSVQPGGGAA